MGPTTTASHDTTGSFARIHGLFSALHAVHSPQHRQRPARATDPQLSFRLQPPPDGRGPFEIHKTDGSCLCSGCDRPTRND